MKTILLTISAILFMAGYLFADNLLQNTQYVGVNTTVSISSYAVTTIAAESGYKEVYIGDPSTTVSIFYSVNGSTINIPTTGWWIPAGTGQKIGFNGIVYLQLGDGETALTARKMTFWR